MVSCNYVTDSQVWLHLKTGQLIAEQHWPVTTDVFSYTETGQPWVDMPWLFQWVNAAIYKLVNDLVPVNPTDPTANRASAEQIAVGSLVVVSAWCGWRPRGSCSRSATADRASGGRRSS